MSKRDKAVVVIPFYKQALSAYEEIALQQCFATLSGYDIVAVKPRHLDLAYLTDKFAFAQVLDFDDVFFKDIDCYNRLMLSAVFYEKFLNYDYLLLHQLDAFVFSDELEAWCNKGYDYVGAPWIRAQNYSGLADRLSSEFKRWYYFRYNVKYKDGLPKIGKQLQDRVGNGGFSLRRVKLFYEYCETHKPRIEEFLDMKHPWFNEDIFWSIELNRKTMQVKVPHWKEALKFAFETYPDRALALTNNELPFGCHAWDKHADFWRPYFETAGYNI